MTTYRNRLPQLSGEFFASDGGIETTLIFQQGMDLPEGAAFHLLKDAEGTRVLRRYFDTYAALARRHEVGFVLEAPTWRANRDWAAKIGYDARALADANRKAIDLMLDVREAWERPETPFVISGNIGPRGDGYFPGRRMTVEEARAYHAAQVETFADTAVDMISAFTLNYPEEAIGVVLNARECRVPAVISFTVETDGRLPTGDTLAEAIRRTDEETDGGPVYYMINCAHPEHFADVLRAGGPELSRLRGLRANASRKSHAELDNSPELDTGNPEELGAAHAELSRFLSHLAVVGGCCGTDDRHVDAICRHLVELQAA